MEPRANRRRPWGGAVLLSLLIAVFWVIGCSGGSSSSNSSKNITSSPVDTETGQFIDAPVCGLKYVSGEIEGYTDADGYFEYENGEEVTFFIGGIQIGKPVSGKEIITPVDLSRYEYIDDDETVNIAVFLLSLDTDPEEGKVVIPESVHERAMDSSLYFSSDFFREDAEALLEELTIDNDDYPSVPELVSKTDARAHLRKSLEEVGYYYGGTEYGGVSDDDDTDMDDDTATDDDTDTGDGKTDEKLSLFEWFMQIFNPKK